MREIKKNNITYYIGETRIAQIRQEIKYPPRKDLSQSGIINRSRTINFATEQERELFKKLFDGYSRVKQIPHKVALVDAEGIIHKKQWCYKDSSIQPSFPVQDLVNRIEQHNYLGIFLFITNPGQQELESKKSILIYPSGELPKGSHILDISDSHIYVPGLGEENSYTLEKDIENMIRICSDIRKRK